MVIDIFPLIAFENFIVFIDIIGTLVFAISGVLTAVEKKFDFVGAVIIGSVTAIGGGTIRDVLIGSTPVGWMQNPEYLFTIICAVIICYFFYAPVVKWRKGLFLFDTIGIGLFTILGVQKTLDIGLHPLIAVTMGVVSAVFGGVLRDILTNREPLIFRKEIYATACLIGALAYIFATTLMTNQNVSMIIGISIVIIIRSLSVKFHWTLPYTPRNWIK